MLELEGEIETIIYCNEINRIYGCKDDYRG